MGYALDAQSEPTQLIPTWYVTTDNGAYYWNAVTGDIRPEQAEGLRNDCAPVGTDVGPLPRGRFLRGKGRGRRILRCAQDDKGALGRTYVSPVILRPKDPSPAAPPHPALRATFPARGKVLADAA